MMELNDNEFDAAFREKVFDAEPRFEEAAWNKMEEKLKKRERVVFLRKASAWCLLLLVALGGYYIGFNETAVKSGATLAKQKAPVPVHGTVEQLPVIPDTGLVNTQVTVVTPAYSPGQVIHQGGIYQIKDHFGVVIEPRAGLSEAVSDSLTVKTSVTDVAVLPAVAMKPDSAVIASTNVDVEPASVSTLVNEKKDKTHRSLPVSLSLSLGPEFNSSAALIGGKRGFSTGIGLSIGVAKKLRLQTGLKYSTKFYGTEGYDYTFRNEAIKPLISRVEASCDVLEVPLQASFTLMEDRYRSIDFNAGMSSYFMLKEDYTFKYTEASGYSDRFQEFRNKNQHYFGVIDLSATYYLKLRKEKFRLGLEPYVKIPVTGVGEGNVNLKSSGVALKLRYDLGKKIK